MKKFDHKLNPVFSKEPIEKYINDNAKRFVADDLIYLEVDKLRSNKNQPRKIFDQHAMAELKNSIEAQGILQPILARYNYKEDYYEIIAGERRLMAAKLASLTHVPVLLSRLDDEESAMVAIVENIQRQELSIIEEAIAYNKLITEFKLTHEEIANKVGKSRSLITNLLRVLHLPKNIKDGIINNQIQLGHAKIILSIESDEMKELFYKTILNNKFSVRECEKHVKNFQEPQEYKAYSAVNNIQSTVDTIKIDKEDIAKKFTNLLQQSVVVKINKKKETLIKIKDLVLLMKKLDLLLEAVKPIKSRLT